MLKYIDQIEDNVVIVFITHRKALSAEKQNCIRQTKRWELELYSTSRDGLITFSTGMISSLRFRISHSHTIVPRKGLCDDWWGELSAASDTKRCRGLSGGAHLFFRAHLLAHRVPLIDAFFDQHRTETIANFLDAKCMSSSCHRQHLVAQWVPPHLVHCQKKQDQTETASASVDRTAWKHHRSACSEKRCRGEIPSGVLRAALCWG